MHTEIRTPTEARIQRAQKILANVREIDRQRRILAQKERRLLKIAGKLLDVPVLEVL